MRKAARYTTIFGHELRPVRRMHRNLYGRRQTRGRYLLLPILSGASGAPSLTDVAVDAHDNVYVSDYGQQAVYFFPHAGKTRKPTVVVENSHNAASVLATPDGGTVVVSGGYRTAPACTSLYARRRAGPTPPGRASASGRSRSSAAPRRRPGRRDDAGRWRACARLGFIAQRRVTAFARPARPSRRSAASLTTATPPLPTSQMPTTGAVLCLCTPGKRAGFPDGPSCLRPTRASSTSISSPLRRRDRSDRGSSLFPTRRRSRRTEVVALDRVHLDDRAKLVRFEPKSRSPVRAGPFKLIACAGRDLRT